MTSDGLGPLLRTVKEWVHNFLAVAMILEGIAYWVNANTSYKIPEKWIAAGMGGSVVLAVLWLTLAWCARRIQKVLFRGISERFAGPNETEIVHRLCRSFYDRDDHVINLEPLRAFMSANKHTAKLFYKKGQSEPVGLYIVFAITKEAANKYLAGDFKNAQVLTARHAVCDRGKPAALYVTNIAASGFSAKGKALESLELDLRQRSSVHRSICHVFVRRANEDGGRIISKYGFQKIFPEGPDEQIWRRSI
jgi:hypothetical protein